MTVTEPGSGPDRRVAARRSASAGAGRGRRGAGPGKRQQRGQRHRGRRGGAEQESRPSRRGARSCWAGRHTGWAPLPGKRGAARCRPSPAGGRREQPCSSPRHSSCGWRGWLVIAVLAGAGLAGQGVPGGRGGLWRVPGQAAGRAVRCLAGRGGVGRGSAGRGELAEPQARPGAAGGQPGRPGRAFGGDAAGGGRDRDAGDLRGAGRVTDAGRWRAGQRGRAALPPGSGWAARTARGW